MTSTTSLFAGALAHFGRAAAHAADNWSAIRRRRMLLVLNVRTSRRARRRARIDAAMVDGSATPGGDLGMTVGIARRARHQHHRHRGTFYDTYETKDGSCHARR
jgi:hypothetical protein